MKTPLILALLALAGSTIASAQESPAQSPPGADAPTAATPESASSSEARKAKAAITFYGDHTFASDLEDSEGDASVWRIGSTLDMSFPVMTRSEIGLSFRAERWGFDVGESANAAWDDATNLATLLSFRSQINERWSWAVGGGVEAGFADGADFGESLTGGGFVSASHQCSDNLSVGIGVLARTRLEEDAIVLPTILLDWKISDKWRLGTSPSIGRRLVSLAYTPGEDWTFALGAGYEALDFRLDEDNSAAPSGVARYRRIPVGGEIAWHPSGQFTLGLFAGVHVWQEYTLDNERGDRISREDADPAAFLGGFARWAF
ncbi:MAG: hypothetical protein KF864_02610 [Phycisphaeraceae bacterium]|nr:hypothetical protein [Phycisphaeraceae bacterium]